MQGKNGVRNISYIKQIIQLQNCIEQSKNTIDNKKQIV
jgi:hypothetical protein